MSIKSASGAPSDLRVSLSGYEIEPPIRAGDCASFDFDEFLAAGISPAEGRPFVFSLEDNYERLEDLKAAHEILKQEFRDLVRILYSHSMTENKSSLREVLKSISERLSA
jgi:hypothetical protein